MLLTTFFGSQSRLDLPVLWQLKSLVDKLQAQGIKKLPTESQLVAALGVNKLWLRRNLQTLCRDGVLFHARNRVYLIQEPKVDISIRRHNSYTRNLLAAKLKPHMVILGIDLVAAKHDLATVFGDADPVRQLWAIDMVRHRENQPLSAVRMYLRQDLTPGLNSYLHDDVSITAILETHYGIIPSRLHTYCEAVIADACIADYLKIPTGSPVLKTTNVSLWQGNCFEYTVTFLRADRCRIRIDVPQTDDSPDGV